jgi:GT2 family glycosyltransferase
VQTIVAGYWRLLGKKLRARNRIRRILSPPVSVDYGSWLKVHEPRWAKEIPGLLSKLQSAGQRPTIGLLLVLKGDERVSRDTLRSLTAQVGMQWQAVVVAPTHDRFSEPLADVAAARCTVLEMPETVPLSTRLNAGIDALTADWFVVLRNGDRLAIGALARVANAAVANTDAAAIYGDHDLIAGSGRRHQPHFKPGWNWPLFVAYDYVDTVVFARKRAIARGGFRCAHAGLEVNDLLLRVAASSENGAVVHIPRILLHRCDWADREATPQDLQLRRAMVEDHLAQYAERASVQVDAFGHVRVVRALPDPAPLVSLIIPTRDRSDLLRSCIEGLRRTDYPAIEIVIADNESRRRDTRRYFDSLAGDPRIRILPVPGAFNYAAINNAAVRVARGTVICLINNDIQVMDPGWLGEMVSHAVRPELGAVGAKLLYSEGSVQHAGVILGLNGLAGHAHRFFPAEQLGYMRRLQTPQYLAAVTAACMVIERRKFEEVGGFDETAFPVAFNDVDLCLKLRKRGYQNYYTPYATLYHKESASRAKDFSRVRRHAFERECAKLKSRWGQVLADDPHYNPNLTQTKEDFSLL